MEFACLVVNFLARFVDDYLLTMEEQPKMAQSTYTSAIKSCPRNLQKSVFSQLTCEYVHNR
jgi:hypothetical protein